jgi:hypothetical protein
MDEYQDVADQEYSLVKLLAGLGASEDKSRSVQINLSSKISAKAIRYISAHLPGKIAGEFIALMGKKSALYRKPLILNCSSGRYTQNDSNFKMEKSL